jgi:hypothetical protein
MESKMAVTIYQVSVPAFIRMLDALSHVLKKGEAHCTAKKIDPEVLLSTRLFPDMYPLSRQVQLSTDFAKGAGARLAGREVPKFEDVEKTFPELQARIEKTIAFLKSVPEQAYEGGESREVTIPIGGSPRAFTGLDYLLNFAQPNFYFHVTTAYDILRHCGVEIGKRDFMGIR